MIERRAITINSLNGSPFPTNINFSLKNGVYSVYLIPVSVLEVMNFINQDSFLVFNVDHYEHNDGKPRSLAEVVSKHSIYQIKFDEETLVMDRKSVIRLLDEIAHYNFCLIDVEPQIEIDKVIEIIDFVDKWNETTIIDRVGSNIFLSSHDDCYLHIETSNENLALNLISSQIKILVSTVLNCSINDLKFNPKELAPQAEFSIMIPQNSVKTPERTTWKIYNATYRDFIYNPESIESTLELVYFEADKTIKIKKVRRRKASD